MDGLAVLLVFVGGALLTGAAIEAAAQWLDRRDDRKDQAAARRALRQQAWREARLLDFDWTA